MIMTSGFLIISKNLRLITQPILKCLILEVLHAFTDGSRNHTRSLKKEDPYSTWAQAT
jgi:hypothetical protein